MNRESQHPLEDELTRKARLKAEGDITLNMLRRQIRTLERGLPGLKDQKVIDRYKAEIAGLQAEHDRIKNELESLK